jgi:hypothetical protein
MNAFLESGYPYELAGLIYYAFFLVMSRRRGGARFSRRSQILTLLAAIVLAASVPFHYANTRGGHIVMIVLAVASLVSTWRDQSVRARAASPTDTSRR